MRAASPPYERQVGEGGVRARREPRVVGGRARRAGVHPRQRARGPAGEVRAGARGGALPVPARGADRRPLGEAIGAITAHTEAPREFSDDEVDFIVTSGLARRERDRERAALRGDALRVAELEQLTELAEAIARADALDELLETVVVGARRCSRARVPRLPPRPGDARSSTSRRAIPSRERAPDARSRRARARACARRPQHAARGPARGDRRAHRAARRGRQTRVELGRAIASQVAVGIKKVQVIEQLTEKNLIKDFFEELAGGRLARRPRGARAHASAATSTSRTSSSSPSRGARRSSAAAAGRARVALRPPRGLAARARPAHEHVERLVPRAAA